MHGAAIRVRRVAKTRPPMIKTDMVAKKESVRSGAIPRIVVIAAREPGQVSSRLGAVFEIAAPFECIPLGEVESLDRRPNVSDRTLRSCTGQKSPESATRRRGEHRSADRSEPGAAYVSGGSAGSMTEHPTMKLRAMRRTWVILSDCRSTPLGPRGRSRRNACPEGRRPHPGKASSDSRAHCSAERSPSTDRASRVRLRCPRR